MRVISDEQIRSMIINADTPLKRMKCIDMAAEMFANEIWRRTNEFSVVDVMDERVRILFPYCAHKAFFGMAEEISEFVEFTNLHITPENSNYELTVKMFANDIIFHLPTFFRERIMQFEALEN